MATGKVGRSQAVSTYGVGSIYELRMFRGTGLNSLHSVMMAGLDWWPRSGEAKIREPVLQAVLKVRYFRLPPVAEDGDEDRCYLPAVRFPRWLVCNRCSQLGVVGQQFSDVGHAGPSCNAVGCGGKGVPTRLVSACFHSQADGAEDSQPGHIDDFPWTWWAHSLSGGKCESPALKLETTGKSASLAGLVVRCLACKKSRSLEQAFGDSALRGLRCSGNRPWLNDREENCSRRIRTLQRGASSVYFAVLASAISIPPYSRSLLQELSSRCDSIVMSATDPNIPMGVLVNMVKNSLPDARDRYSDRQIEEALRYLGGGGPEAPTAASSKEYRSQERKAILEGRTDEDDPDSQFVARPVDRSALPVTLATNLAALVKVHRLREVRALRGFCRIQPPGGLDPYTVRCAPLSVRKHDWLPAIEVRGEGVYLELDADLVREWETRSAVQQRLELLREHVRTSRGGKVPDEQLPSARLVLVHTLSHLLMKQLSLECGYSGASLRERMYVSGGEQGPGELGILIYTATTGSDGTLGGLVRQGSPERLERMLLGALEGARWCSSDPLCIECKGQGVDALNLAACHACCLVSETSCELRNTLLDRGLLIGIPDTPEVAFFGDVVQTFRVPAGAAGSVEGAQR
jgi:hypothetical protein